MQPIVRTTSGEIRFRKNAIVEYLLDHGGLNLNDLAMACHDCPQADWEQFYQLIGYSLCGYHELSRVSDKSCKQASEAARQALDLPEGEAVGCRDSGCEIHCGVKQEGPRCDNCGDLFFVRPVVNTHTQKRVMLCNGCWVAISENDKWCLLEQPPRCQ